MRYRIIFSYIKNLVLILRSFSLFLSLSAIIIFIPIRKAM